MRHDDEDPYRYLMHHARDVERMLNAELELSSMVSFADRCRGVARNAVVLSLIAATSLVLAFVANRGSFDPSEPAGSTPRFAPRSSAARTPLPADPAAGEGTRLRRFSFGSDSPEFALVLELKQYLKQSVRESDPTWRESVRERVAAWDLDALAETPDVEPQLMLAILKSIRDTRSADWRAFVERVASAPPYTVDPQGRFQQLAQSVLTALDEPRDDGSLR